MSSSTACNEYALLFAGCPCADTDAPLRTTELVGACFRFASDGGAGAGDGGERVVPLAAMVMGSVQFAMVVNALRTAEVVDGLSPSPTCTPYDK
jgi:hypothetical protein